MSTPTDCRREDLTCQPDKTIVAEKPECASISEKQFLRDHTMYSAISSWLFAIAGATTIGVLGVLSSKVLSAVEQGKPLFKSADPKVMPVFGNKKFNRIAIGMTAFGAVPMALSNWLESKKVVTEWQLGAGKLQRKANIAEKELDQMNPVEQTIAFAAAPSKALVDSLQTTPPDSMIASANRALASIIAFAFALSTFAPFAAFADADEQYMRDKTLAIHQINPKLEQQCLQDISKKARTVVNQADKLAFNDNITREVYRQFYWNKSDRGVAFIMPVKANDKLLGNINTDIACFYSMTDSGLEFQLSQQITRRL